MSSYEKYCLVQKTAEEHAVKGGFPASRVHVLAVTKNQDASAIEELYNCGIRDFAENRINVLEDKARVLAEDINWHFIGKIQSNKVRRVVKLSKIIHSVDSPELLERIDRISGEENAAPRLFIEVNVSGEESKSGITPDEIEQMLNIPLKHAVIKGLMTMAPFDSTEEELREIFSSLYSCAEKYNLPELSMGMSNDYHIASECGATTVRIGTFLFS